MTSASQGSGKGFLVAAPYKYPRKIVFRDELPKTISGKIQRNLL